MKSELFIAINVFLIIQSFFIQTEGKFNLQRKDFSGDPDLTGDLRVFKKPLRIREPEFRLYKSIVPTNYTLKIRPILGDVDTGKPWTAPGTVHILVDCKETTNNITLHSGVQIIESSVKVTLEPKGSQIKLSRFIRDPEKEFFTILLDSPILLANKSYSISMDFVAEIYTSGDKYRTGIYRSHYTEPISQETRYLVTTQFQPFGARLAYPCFDEPEWKSTFEVTIGRLASNYTTVSNTQLKSTVQNADHVGWVWDTFERTVPMSTYLVAWIVSDYAAVKAPPGIFDKPVQTLAPKHVIDAGYGNYSAKLAAQQLAFYESYFLAKYPLAKMDSAAMVDFTDSAMENWGLNIYSPTTLYYTKEEYREKGRESTSSVIAHELAHQLFGNLVTCKFWTDFYLNEGFASHVEYLAMRNTVPEFETEKTRLVTDMQYAMRFDVLENSHPVQLSAIRNSGADDISFMYPILYKKSAALIRMMEGFLTEKTLQRGLQFFLKKYSFQSVEQDDLFKILTEQAHADHRLPNNVTMKEIMDTWTLQRGYPLVRVSAAGSNQIYVSQEKLNRKNDTKRENGNKWYIPICVATQNNPKLREGDTLPTFWMNTTTTVTNWNHNTSQWIILNSGATGYFRVLYDEHLTKLIQEQLTENHTLLHHGTRSQLLDDQFTLAFEGYSQIEVALNSTKYLGKELEYTVWTPIIRHLRRLYNLLQGNDVILFQKYFEPILNQVFQVIDYEQNQNETGNIILFRAELLEWACEIQHPKCVEYSIELWRDWKDDPEINRIPLDQRSLVYCTALKTEGIIDDFVFVLQRQKFETSDNNKIWLMRAFFSCFNTTDEVIWGKLLNASFEIGSSETPETQKLITTVVILSIAENPFAREIVWAFLENNIDALIQHTGNAKLISGVISTLTTYYNSAAELNRVKKFIEKHAKKLTSVGVMTTLNSAVMFLERNIEWINVNRKRVHEWLTVNSNEILSK